MRRASLIVVIAMSLLARAPADAQDFGFARFGSYIESLRVQAGIPGLAAALVDSTGIVWEQAFGYQDVERAIPARVDTPFHLDGLTQVFTAAVVLRCVEEGRLSLDDRIGKYKPDGPEANATIRQVLTHTAGAPEAPVFAYRPERLELLSRAFRACTDNSFRETIATLLERLAMIDSVPGVDIVHPETLADGIPSESEIDRYRRALGRLAVPYRVDARGRTSISQSAATTLTPGGGLVTTVRDFAQFDLALKNGVLLRPSTMLEIQQVPTAGAVRLPHGLGWFVQIFNGEPILWQYGMGANASSSLLVTVPGRASTLVLLANSDGLVRPFALSGGDVTASPFARLFLGLAIR